MMSRQQWHELPRWQQTATSSLSALAPIWAGGAAAGEGCPCPGTAARRDRAMDPVPPWSRRTVEGEEGKGGAAVTMQLSPQRTSVGRALDRRRGWIAAGLLVHGGLHLVAFRPRSTDAPTGVLPGGVEVLIPSALPTVTSLLLAAAAATVIVARRRRAGAALTAVAALSSLLTFGLAADGLLRAGVYWLPGLIVSGTAFGVAAYLSLRDVRQSRDADGRQ